MHKLNTLALNITRPLFTLVNAPRSHRIDLSSCIVEHDHKPGSPNPLNKHEFEHVFFLWISSEDSFIVLTPFLNDTLLSSFVSTSSFCYQSSRWAIHGMSFMVQLFQVLSSFKCIWNKLLFEHSCLYGCSFISISGSLLSRRHLDSMAVKTNTIVDDTYFCSTFLSGGLALSTRFMRYKIQSMSRRMIITTSKLPAINHNHNHTHNSFV